MTKTLEQAVAEDIRDRGCGMNLDGATIFCDDPRLIGLSDGYGSPLYVAECECKQTAQAAIAAVRKYDGAPATLHHVDAYGNKSTVEGKALI